MTGSLALWRSEQSGKLLCYNCLFFHTKCGDTTGGGKKTLASSHPSVNAHFARKYTSLSGPFEQSLMMIVRVGISMLFGRSK